MGPQSAVQNVADTITATGERPGAVAVNQGLDELSHQRLDNEKQCERPKQHRPAGIDGNGQCERERGGDDCADVRHEAQHRGQDAPQHRTWNADDPQSCSDDDAENSIEQELDQKQSAEARRGIIKRGGRALQVTRTRQPNEAVPEILTLQQNEDDEDDDDAGRGKWMEQWRDQRGQALQRTRIGLANFNGNR